MVDLELRHPWLLRFCDFGAIFGFRRRWKGRRGIPFPRRVRLPSRSADLLYLRGKKIRPRIEGSRVATSTRLHSAF